MAVGAVICYFVCSFIPDVGVLWLILKFAVCIILSNMILILAYLPTKEFKELWKIVKNVFKSIIRRNKGSI